MKKLISCFLLILLITHHFPLSISAKQNKTASCTMTITTKNSYKKPVLATNECKNNVFGYYKSHAFKLYGMYNGEVVKNGQKFKINLPDSKKYKQAVLTVKVVGESFWIRSENW